MIMWSCFLVAPLSLSKEDRERAISSEFWASWILRIDEPDRTNLEESARFFLPGCRDFFMPRLRDIGQSSRWTLFPNKWPELAAPDATCRARIDWVDLLWTEIHPLLLIKVSGNKRCGLQDVKQMATAAASWHPAYPGVSPTLWRAGGREFHLRQWVLGDILRIPTERWDEVDGRVHWFGNDLPSAATH